MSVDRKQLAELRDLAAGRSEASLWPTCLMCCERKAIEHGHPVWVPVEEYGVEHGPPIGPKYVERMTVRAKCSHGSGKGGDEQHAVIDVPLWWGNAHRVAAVQQCCFFGPAQYRTHALVVEIT